MGKRAAFAVEMTGSAKAAASHYDEEDIGYMTDPSFWKMIEARRKEPSIPFEVVKRELEQRERAERAEKKSNSKNGKKGKRNGSA